MVVEGQKRLYVAFADFAEHPAEGFVNEIVRMRQKEGAESEGVGEFACTDEGLGGDALLPEAGGGGEGIWHGAVSLEEPGTEDMWGAGIDEVPVVDPLGVGEESLFMPFGVEEVQHVGLAECIGVGEFGTDLRHVEPEEEIALAILAGAGFEESPSDGRLFGRGGVAAWRRL